MLEGILSVWCPETNYYAENARLREQLQQRRELGEEIWAYVACNPKGAYCNFAVISQESIRFRLLFWQLRKYRIEGLLYWETVFWKQGDPWDNIHTFQHESSGGSPGYHAIGDGILMYPGTRVGIAGPVSSLRLECILAGMQDIEYFELLAQTAGEDAVQQIIAEMVTDWTHYSLDNAKLATLRRRIGDRLAEHSSNKQSKGETE